ncbi:MAG: DUF86 domain-containing protein [Candidatus Hydrothermarchaeaceae archaeon]
MISEEIVHAKIDIIEENLKLLKEISGEGFESFSKNYRDIQATKHSLQEAIEACLDIGNHIIAEKRLRRAEDYKEIFEIVGEQGIIESNLSKRLQEMAKFRNLLVHSYGELDLKRIFGVISEDLIDIEEYVSSILKVLS